MIGYKLWKKIKKFLRVALESELANVGFHLVVDAEARQVYARQISVMSSELRASANSGKISWTVAANQAQEM